MSSRPKSCVASFDGHSRAWWVPTVTNAGRPSGALFTFSAISMPMMSRPSIDLREREEADQPGIRRGRVLELRLDLGERAVARAAAGRLRAGERAAAGAAAGAQVGEPVRAV